MPILRLGNYQITYFVKKNPDSKYVQLKFRPNSELEVTVPSDHYDDVKRILLKKRPWIQRKYEEIASGRRIFDGKHVSIQGNLLYRRLRPKGKKTSQSRQQ